MENKKLTKILLKDMGELEEMIFDIKKRGTFDALELEFLYTRAKGIMQLLKMLNGFETNDQIKESTDNQISKDLKEESKKVIIEREIEEKSIYVKVESSELNNRETQSEEKTNPEEAKIEGNKEIAKEIKQEANTENKIEKEIGESLSKQEVDLEEETAEPSQRLGDSFLKGKSVNDLITDQNKLEFKLSNRPVTSIKTAIGINDRFQYIRELFDGNSDKFTSTVSELDSMADIDEAVVFLRQNFKWKKNETSLKFVNLVKRRFTDE